MANLFSADDIAFLRRPSIARAWFADLDLLTGSWKLHNGFGDKLIDGQLWHGITDPAGGQIVSIGTVEDPRFGQAAKVDVVLSGINVDFLRSVKTNGRQLEGRRVDMYWCAFDQETQEVWPSGLKKLFPGKMSSPKISWRGINSRTVAFTIESLWHSQNFSFGGLWTPADQKVRYPGDKGLDYVGVKVQEIIRAD